MDLNEWTITYVKNKDITLKKITKIEDKKNHVIVHYKDKVMTFLISPKIDDKIVAEAKAFDNKTIVCLNNEENFAYLVKHWNALSEPKNFSFLFVAEKSNDKWLINPHIHSMIADPESIEQGLRTMYDTANGKVAEVKPSKKKSSMFEESSSSEDDEGDGE